MSLDDILMLAAFEISYLSTSKKGFAHFRLESDATVRTSVIHKNDDATVKNFC